MTSGRGDRVAEDFRLENGRAREGSEGSNPSPSSLVNIVLMDGALNWS